jgi:hypothetical protein
MTRWAQQVPGAIMRASQQSFFIALGVFQKNMRDCGELLRFIRIVRLPVG